MDPVIADLDRWLDEQDEAIAEEEQAELELYKERLDWALRLLCDESIGLDVKARRIVAAIEEEIEEDREQR